VNTGENGMIGIPFGVAESEKRERGVGDSASVCWTPTMDICHLEQHEGCMLG